MEYGVAFGGVFPLVPVALAAGLSPQHVRTVRQKQKWWQPYPGVVALPGMDPESLEVRTRAAAVYCGAQPPDVLPDKVVAVYKPRLVAVTGLTAAHFLGIHPSAPTKLHLVLPANRMMAHRNWQVVRSRTLTSDDVVWRDLLPLASPPRLVRDLAAYFTIGKLRAMVIDLLHAKLLTRDDLQVLCRGPQFPGIGKVREILAALDNAGRVDAPWELEVRERFAAAGILFDRGQVRLPVPGPPIHSDFGIVSICLGVELVSFGYHSAPEAVEKDAERARRIAAHAPVDWRIYPITWPQWHDDPDAVIAEVRELIVAQSLRHLGVPWPRPSDLAR